MAELLRLARRFGFLLALVAAAPPAAAAEPIITAAQAELPRLRLTLLTRTGHHPYSVELAGTPEAQQRGLMFRTRMARDRGMLFPFAPPRPASFWMENTVLPLDLVFIGANGQVRNIAANAAPFSRAYILSDGPVAAVLELNAGEAARVGLRPGDRVRYRLPG